MSRPGPFFRIVLAGVATALSLSVRTGRHGSTGFIVGAEIGAQRFTICDDRILSVGALGAFVRHGR